MYFMSPSPTIIDIHYSGGLSVIFNGNAKIRMMYAKDITTSPPFSGEEFHA